MAGAGRRVFQPGEVLTASNVMSYLQDQAVQVYAGTAARGSAIGSAVSEGMVSYLADSNAVEVYNGSAWNQVSQAISPNYVINGAFDIWQRGTAQTSTGYGAADRWKVDAVTATVLSRGSAASQYPTTPGDYCLSLTATNATNSVVFAQTLESSAVSQLRGKTVTLSFYVAGTAGASISAYVQKASAADNSAATWDTIASSTFSGLSTSITRYTVTAVVPSDSSAAGLRVAFSTGNNPNASTVNVMAVQLEEGSTATPFRRNANSLQGELAACMRYFYQIDGGTADGGIIPGTWYSSNELWCVVVHPVPMRTCPTIGVYPNSPVTLSVYASGSGNRGYSSFTTYGTSATQTKSIIVRFVAVSGVTAGVGGWVGGNGCYVNFSSEL